MRPRKAKSRFRAIGKLLLAAVPVLALAWGVIAHFYSLWEDRRKFEHEVARKLAEEKKADAEAARKAEEERKRQETERQEQIGTQFVLMEKNTLLDFLEGQPIGGLPTPRYQRSGLTGRILDSFTPEAIESFGVTRSGTFLLFHNRTKTDVEVVNAADQRALGKMKPDEALAVCVAWEKPDGSNELESLSRVDFVTVGWRLSRQLEPIPARKQMMVLPGTKGAYTYYPPPS